MAWREAAWSSGSRLAVPAWLEWLVLFGLVLAFSGGFRAAERAQRWAIGVSTGCLILYVCLVRGPELYFAIGPGFLQSRRAALLSSVFWGLPLIGLFALLLLFVFSFGLYELLGARSGPGWLPERYRRGLGVALSLAFLGFGLLAVFGYGSGSPWPFFD